MEVKFLHPLALPIIVPMIVGEAHLLMDLRTLPGGHLIDLEHHEPELDAERLGPKLPKLPKPGQLVTNWMLWLRCVRLSAVRISATRQCPRSGGRNFDHNL